MSNDNPFERLYKLQAATGKMVVDGARDASLVANHLQQVIDDPERFSAPKFALLADLGIITVPEGFDHKNLAEPFGDKFPNPSYVLKPGMQLRVSAWYQIVEGLTTTAERIAHCAKQSGNRFVGAQGAVLVHDQLREQLPKGKWYASFDKRESLYDAGGFHHVPEVCADSFGDFKFVFGDFESGWIGFGAFFSFCDEQPSVA